MNTARLQSFVEEYGEKGAATRLGLSVAKLRAQLKRSEPRSRIPAKGPRGYAWDAFREEYLIECIETDMACCLCGMPITMRSQLAHLVPRDLAPDLILVAANVVPICAKHPQVENHKSGMGLIETLREQYGNARAEWAEREMRARGLIKT